MQIHALCLIKNEADVIEECLRSAATWCDHIYVWDNGSDDGTWEIVKKLGAELKQVRPWRQLATDKFADGLRKYIFEEFRNEAKAGDWWVRLDADEFYSIQNPRHCLQMVRPEFGKVYNAFLAYYFSSAAAADYEKNPERYADSVPTSERCRWYINHWSDLRFVRHEVMVSSEWDPKRGRWGGWPGAVATARPWPARILCRHYAYRSPAQIERRLQTRLKSALSGEMFRHEVTKNFADKEAGIAMQKKEDVAYCTSEEEVEFGWRSKIIDAKELCFDGHDGNFVIRHDLMSPLRERRPAIRQEFVSLVRRIFGALRRRLGI